MMDEKWKIQLPSKENRNPQPWSTFVCERNIRQVVDISPRYAPCQVFICLSSTFFMNANLKRLSDTLEAKNARIVWRLNKLSLFVCHSTLMIYSSLFFPSLEISTFTDFRCLCGRRECSILQETDEFSISWNVCLSEASTASELSS